MSDMVHKILRGVKVDLTEAFDRNFERKAFFNGAPWKPVKRRVSRGSLLVRTSAMRNSIRSRISGESIVFSSSEPQTAIHNEGGVIKRVSKKGKSYSITMPKRQFIGHGPEVDAIVQKNVESAVKSTINDTINQYFKGNG